METKNYEKSGADSFINKLLNDGAKEGIDHTTPLQVPGYYDEPLYKKAQKYYLKYLFLMFGSHLCGLISVISIPSIYDVLITTNETGTVQKAYRRYLRTIFHVVSWMLFPLKPGSIAWKSLDVVRKVHARASKSCENSIKVKITQKDLVLTQYAFVGIAALEAEDVLPDTEKEDFYKAWMHFWRVNGYMLGIKEEYNLCNTTVEDTKARFYAIRSRIYKVALENVNEGFNKLAENLVNGLWFHSPGITPKSVLFLTKWSAKCEGYQYLDKDFKSWSPQKNTKLAYKDLGWYHRFLIAFSFFTTNVLYKFSLLRWYFNIRILFTVVLSYYLPILAACKFGIKEAYVRIFDKAADIKTAKNE